jgi:hypothetical protein
MNQAQTPAEEKALTHSIERSRPFGNQPWVQRTAEKLQLQQSLRPRGRPPAGMAEAKKQAERAKLTWQAQY